MQCRNVVSFFNSKMQLENFQVFNICKLSCSHSGSNLDPNYLTDTLKNLENASVEMVIIKCYHTTIFSKMNYITYINED